LPRLPLRGCCALYCALLPTTNARVLAGVAPGRAVLPSGTGIHGSLGACQNLSLLAAVR